MNNQISRQEKMRMWREKKKQDPEWKLREQVRERQVRAKAKERLQKAGKLMTRNECVDFITNLRESLGLDPRQDLWYKA